MSNLRMQQKIIVLIQHLFLSKELIHLRTMKLTEGLTLQVKVVSLLEQVIEFKFRILMDHIDAGYLEETG